MKPWTIALGAFAVVGIIALIALVAVPALQGQELSAAERSKVADYNYAFSSTVVDGSQFRETLDGVDYLIALCRKKAGAKYDDKTVREIVEDGANTLRPYQPDLAAKLDRVLDGSCKE